MQFDDLTQRAIAALAPQVDRYRAAVTQALQSMRDYLAARRHHSDGGAAEAALELGRFAAGRVDGSRFAAVFTGTQILDPDTALRIERCADVLQDLLELGDVLLVRGVTVGGDVREAVDEFLADGGRAFGAVLMFQAVRNGVYRAGHHDAHLFAFPFARWNRGERLLAPPLIIEVDGADLRAESLAEYLDGRARLVFIVRGESPPAPLMRLITPGTMLIQDSDPAALDLLRDFDGPAAAILSDKVARFVHDPRGGRTLRERLSVSYVPTSVPRHSVGGRSAWQQAEELAQLTEYARKPSDGPVAAAAPAPSVAAAPSSTGSAGLAGQDGVGVLTNWLLAQGGFETPAAGGSGDGVPGK